MSRLCSAQEIREVADSGDGVFVLFYASWCPFSLAFLPVFERRAESGETEFVRVLLDGNERLFEEHDVSVYPTVLFFRNGAVARRLDGTPFVGLKDNQLSELVSSCLKDGAQTREEPAQRGAQIKDPASKKFRVKVTKDGPYVATGGIPLAQDIVLLGSDQEPEKWEKGPSYPLQKNYVLCRCGASKNKPFCDGSHFAACFDGTETAAKTGTLERTEKTVGQEIDLTFSEELCAAARFCHGGEEAWGYAERSSDPEARKKAVEEACACPSGSLTAWDKKTGRMIEPDLEPSIGLIESPQTETGGPIWVKGGIPIESADGGEYEVRNRVTLCRCGQSKNKPFCDGTHVAIGFKSDR